MPRLYLPGLLVVGLVGCGTSREAPPRLASLRVAAASDLQGALPILAERFKSLHGVEVTPVFGSSGQLAQQIEQEAPMTSSSRPARRSSSGLPRRGP